MQINITTLQFPEDLYEVMKIRNEVFIKEQKVSEEEEYDEFEDSCIHYLATVDNTPVGTARIRKTQNGTKLERFAVLIPYRNKGVASKILNEVLQHPWVNNQEYVYLHAQTSAKGFYLKHGFEEIGNEFIEADIQHIKMYLKR